MDDDELDELMRRIEETGGGSKAAVFEAAAADLGYCLLRRYRLRRTLGLGLDPFDRRAVADGLLEEG